MPAFTTYFFLNFMILALNLIFVYVIYINVFNVVAWFVQSYMGPMTNFKNLEVIMKLWRASLTIHNVSVSYQSI